MEASKKMLVAIDKNFRNKEDVHSRTLSKVREKCQNQFELQSKNYIKFEEIEESKLQAQSKKVLDKYNSQQQKSKDLETRANQFISDHKDKNYERFSTRDEGL